LFSKIHCKNKSSQKPTSLPYLNQFVFSFHFLPYISQIFHRKSGIVNLTNTLNGHQKKNGEVSIRLYVSDGDKRRYLATGLSILPKYWDKAKGEVRSNYALAKSYNRKLLLHKRKVEAFLMDGGNLECYGKKTESGSIISFFEAYIGSNHGLKHTTLKSYNTALKRLREYADFIGKNDLQWEDIDKSFYHDFSDCVLQNGANWSGLTKHLRLIKKLTKVAYEKGIHKNEVYIQSWVKASDNQ